MPEPHQTTLLADGEGVVRMASSAAAELLGTSARDLEGLRLHELMEAPGREVVETLLRSLAERAHAPFGETALRLAARLRLPEGRLAEADLRLSRLPEGSPIPGATLISIELLGAQRQAAAGAIPAVPEEVRSAAHDDGLIILSGGLIVQADEGMGSLVGVDPAAMAGRRVQGLVASEDLLPVMEILRDVESGREAAGDFGFRLLRTGDRPPIEVSARARRIAHKGVTCVLLGLRDVSESVRASRAAAHRLAHLDAALSAAGDGVLLLGPPESGSPVILASRMLESLLGIEARGWIGRPLKELWAGSLGPLHRDPEGAGRLLEVLDEPLEEIRVDTVEMASPDGRTLERYVGPMRASDGRLIGRILTLRDVTHRARAEAEVRRAAEEARQAREELAMLHEELRLANEGLERRMAETQRLNKDLKVLDEMKSNLLANVSHELQTPLVSIKGFTEMILKGRLGGITPEQERGLQVALRNINRLIGLIDNLLAFARTQGAATALKVEAFPLGPLVEEALALMKEQADSRGVSMRASLPPGDLMVRADRDRILQVILNLISNAVKYNRKGGEVAVEAEAGRKGTARVEVRDTGIGIPREELDRIFDRHYQAGNAKGLAQGEGIGLSIAKNILRLHGCMIRADSEEGKGSVFSFTLPLDRKPRSEKGPRFTAQGAAPALSLTEPAAPAGQQAPAGRAREET